MTQLEGLGVPEDHLDGHAFHTYRLTSPDGTVQVRARASKGGKWREGVLAVC